MKRRISILVAAVLLLAAPAFGFTNPSTLKSGVYTPIAVSSTPVSVGSGYYFLFKPTRVEIQNECSCAITVQLHGAAAVFGQGLVLQSGQEKIWTEKQGPVPEGPFSFITQGGGSCPDITCTPDTGNGVSVLELIRSTTGNP